MSLIEQYESLKKNGTWVDRLQFLRTLSNPVPIENYLKRPTADYEDMRLRIRFTLLNKDQGSLLEIFNQSGLPVEQRLKAGEAWLRLEKDENNVHNLIVNTIQDKSIPSRIKFRILKYLHDVIRGKRVSTSFFYNLARALTQSVDHDQFNIDAHTVPYCSSVEQIMDLFSRWSMSRWDQIDSTSPLRSKLLTYQPLVAIQLIKNDLELKYHSIEEVKDYFRLNRPVFLSLTQKEPKAMCRLCIDHLNRLDKSNRVLPSFVQEKQTIMFARAPSEMIELLLLVGQYQPGSIKYYTGWRISTSTIPVLSFPSSFSTDHYVQLFLGLYETCKWSSAHLPNILRLMLKVTPKNRYLIRKQNEWFYNQIVVKKIGKEEFVKRLLKQGDEACLSLLANYTDLSAPLARRLLADIERVAPATARQQLEYLRYEPMNEDVFNKFLSLFKQLGSDVNERTKNYPLLLQCAVETDPEWTSKVLQWIAKRFTNEQLPVIEHFLRHLSHYDDQFQLGTVPSNLDTIEQIMDIALNHLQHDTRTIQIMTDYAILLLKKAEYCRNPGDQAKLREWVCQMIRRCFSADYRVSLQDCSLTRSMPTACTLLASILINDIFPLLISKAALNEFEYILTSAFHKSWHPSEIDTYLVSFFFDHLAKSSKLQAAFRIQERQNLIRMLLKERSTRLSYAQRLVKEIHEIFLFDAQIQHCILRSKHDRSLIDRLVRNEKLITVADMTPEQNSLYIASSPSLENIKMPGLLIEILVCNVNQLTGKEQEHITHIILNDYLMDREVTNSEKLKVFRVLRRIPSMYKTSVEWLHKRQDSSESSLSGKKSHSYSSRGADGQSIDDIAICVPASFDLPEQDLKQELQLLMSSLSAKNAKYISNAMTSISKKLPDEIFLNMYLDFVMNGQCQKLGITTNKEILRLLAHYRQDSTLIDRVFSPWWTTRPHDDIRACLITTILYFFERAAKSETSAIWSILEQASNDEYMPVIHALFDRDRRGSKWNLRTVAHTNSQLYCAFVDRIQCRVLDYPTKLEARTYAWSQIDRQYANIEKLSERAKIVCTQFDKDANTCWEPALKTVIACCQKQRYTLDFLIDLVRSIMSRREEIDSTQNAIDAQHDLPVYHRIHHILRFLTSQVDQFRKDHGETMRTIANMTLQFDSTLALAAGQIFIGLTTNREDLYAVLADLETRLPGSYYERIISQLGSELAKNNRLCPFISELSTDGKLELVQWLINEKHQELFVFNLLTEKIFTDSSVNREQCQALIRQMRQSNNLYVREKALEYTVVWREDGGIDHEAESESDEMDVWDESD